MNPCPLCRLWEMMPYHKRWSTPTSPQECEGAMVAGWWAVSNTDFTGKICPRHQAVIVTFNNQMNDRKRVAEEMAVRVEPGHEKSVGEFLERAKALGTPPPPVQPFGPPPVVPSFAAAPPAPLPIPPAPGNVMTAPPPVAVMNPPTPEAVATFPCPLCGKSITNGKVHSCSTDE